MLLAVPNIGGPEHHWMNGLYESFCIIIMFPFIVYLGACGKVTGKKASKVCKFLGDISFPIYITHYPLIYLFTAWFYNHHMPKPVPGQMPQQDLSLVPEALPWMLLVFFSAIAIAYLSMHNSKLLDFDPEHQDRTFCCPRTWEFTSDLIQGRELDDDDSILLAGTITSGEAISFVQFTKVYKNLPKFNDIMNNPEGA